MIPESKILSLLSFLKEENRYGCDPLQIFNLLPGRAIYFAYEPGTVDARATGSLGLIKDSSRVEVEEACHHSRFSGGRF